MTTASSGTADCPDRPLPCRDVAGRHYRGASRAGPGRKLSRWLPTLGCVLAALISGLVSGPVSAAVYLGHPGNYTALVRALEPGDRLLLRAGIYRRGLNLHRLSGTPQQSIVIAGPASGEKAVFLGRDGRNTVSLVDAAHIVLRDIEIDGQGAFVDAVKAEGHAAFTHHITLENLYIHGFAQQQQSVGISTKCPSWDWTVRGNRIVGVGTGIYFGNSNGADPFVGGLIEDNVIEDTIGYNLQIKHQTARPLRDGMPGEPRRTIIRRNRFSKAENASTGPAARPNVLLGHFPPDGVGAEDEYVVYGNLFFQNPAEALFQGEGNIALYNNLFFNSRPSGFPAVAIQPHNGVPRRIRVFFNTVVNPDDGIRLSLGPGSERFEQRISGNAVFAGRPLQGGRTDDNHVTAFERAGDMLQMPIDDLVLLSLAPRGKALRATAPIEVPSDYPDVGLDFHGRPRDEAYYGAVAGSGRR